MRPLGIASLEDKIVQQAAHVILECVYEQDFLGFNRKACNSSGR